MKKISDFNSATEKYPVVYAGSASRPEYVDMPTTLQQQEGVAPIDTLPAQWWNAMWKLATKDINAFRDFVGDAFTEINNLLTKFGITLDDADSEQLYDFFHDDYVQNYLSSALHSVFVYKSGDTIDGDLHIKGDLSVDGIGEEVISTELKVGANTITLRNGNPTALGNTELAGVVTENYDGNNNNNIIAIDKNGEARTGDIDIATRILYSNNGTNFFTDEDLTIPATIGATEEVRDTGNQTSGGVEIYEGITYSNDDTQPLLTRAESNAIANGHILVWDATNKRAVDGGSIIDRIYPVGSIYQNYSDARNPGTIFGVGTWTQITDKFLACRGSQLTEGAGAIVGNFSYKLTESNIPAHNHAIGGTLNDQTSGEVANISPVTFNHKHYYNVSHYHTITDNGHYHNLSFDAEGSYTLVRSYGSGSAYNSIQNGTTDQYLPMYASKNYTGITVDERTITGYTDNPDTATIPITQGTHSHGLKTYGLSSPTSINTTPPYQAVYTWYRTA